ncbi:MAG: PDZ domain-containing protein, partial [Spirochaetaceae bacterium]|nr:PDZ domain-containing protein [Spirochaetaceae bacterium]
DQLVREVGDIPAGETATFVVLRNGKEVTLRAKVEERKEETVTNNSKLWPGFTAVPLTEDVRKQLKLEDKVKGVLVVNIVSKSPAAILSLRNGDVITAVNGKDVKNVTEFFEAVSNTSNKEIWFDVLRDGHKISTVKYKI